MQYLRKSIDSKVASIGYQKGLHMQNLAPIAIGTYNRLSHLKLTIRALQSNHLAQLSTLYIFSDAAQEGDEEGVNRLREYLTTITGFKEVIAFKRLVNDRVANNRGGIQYLLKKYGKVIFLEDDNITSAHFITFMNESLNFYQDFPSVLSICGYTPDFKLTETQKQHDVIALPRLVGWGVGMWEDKVELIPEITSNDYQKIINNPSAIDHINQNHGRDLINRFRAESLGHIDGLDNKACFLQTQTNMFSVHPKQSLVQNIGNDGSGVHSSKNNKYDVQLWHKEDAFMFDKNIKLEKNIVSQSVEFFSPNEQDMSSEVLVNVFAQLQHKGITACSLWGIDILSKLFIQSMPDSLTVNYMLDSWANEGTIFEGRDVITPQQAYEKGEKNIVIMSYASRFKMLDAGKKISEVLDFTYYQE